MKATATPPSVPAVEPACRADLRTVAAIQSALQRQRYRPLQVLDFRFAHGKVTLQGTLPSYYLKQLAQEAIRNVPGVRCIDNRTIVE